MELFKSLIVILLSSVLVNNYVLARFLGICPFLGVSKKLDQATGMGIAVTVVMLLASAVTWPIQYFLLDKVGLGYMQTIVFILVIASLVQMMELLLKKLSPALHKGLGVYLPLGVGLGFLLAMVLFSGLRSRIDETNIPKPFRGLAVTLIAASFISLAFMGFAGIVDALFA